LSISIILSSASGLTGGRSTRGLGRAAEVVRISGKDVVRIYGTRTQIAVLALKDFKPDLARLAPSVPGATHTVRKQALYRAARHYLALSSPSFFISRRCRLSVFSMIRCLNAATSASLV
jgi:hypothetical protein